jgi:guanylate kinase
MTKRIILVGKAGSGKDYLAGELTKFQLLKDVGYTTRPIREGERQGIDYYYISEIVFASFKKQGLFYETANFNNWFYGTSKESWKTCHIFIMTPVGVASIKPEDRKDCFIVYLNISEEVRRSRISKRSDADSVERRIAADELDFADFTDYDLIVIDPFFKTKNILHKWKYSSVTNKTNIQMEDKNQNQQPQTLGQKRVKAEFNPSKNDLVDQIKNTGAHFIDLCEQLKTKEATGEKIRLLSLAQTEAEAASMWAVKACFTD